MSIYLHKSHNVSVLIYHVVCPAKYRKAVITEGVEKEIKEVCMEIAKRYEVHFLEIGADKDHVHFLIQTVPTYEVSRMVRMIKSITAREVFRRKPEVRKELWGGEFWSDGYFVNTVGRTKSEESVRKHVKEQGREKEYEVIHQDQLRLV